MTRGIAKRNGRPAHELFEGRTRASELPRLFNHEPLEEPGFLARLFNRSARS